jgi:hydrogenase nickel incorporation protein HypB
MCKVCGCVGDGHVHVAGSLLHSAAPKRLPKRFEVMQTLLNDNDHQAAHNRAHFAMTGMLVVNLMSSPGAGKTSLLETTIRALAGSMAVAVIEGDLETENDARRIRAAGARAVQITTGNACHLDAMMVHAALHELDLEGIDILFIENVGNLVCPAGFDLGQHRNVVLLSVTEGDDKPEKYPVMFRAADLVGITKLDLLDAVGDFAPDRAKLHLRNLASAAPVLEISARSKVGMSNWIDWLVAELALRRNPGVDVPVHDHAHPHLEHTHA